MFLYLYVFYMCLFAACLFSVYVSVSAAVMANKVHHKK